MRQGSEVEIVAHAYDAAVDVAAMRSRPIARHSLGIVEGAVAHSQRLEDPFLHRLVIGGADFKLSIDERPSNVTRSRSHQVVVLEELSEFASGFGRGQAAEGV